MPDSIYDISVNRIDHKPTSLGEYRGKVVLVVNVASACGLTPQYKGLEKLYRDYGDKGLVVTGFPSNDFGAQEPGTEEEIAAFCETQFNVTFPMFEKVKIKGEDQHPLYNTLVAAKPEAVYKEGGTMKQVLTDRGRSPTDTSVAWNFEKFLIDRKGAVIGRFAPDVTPDDPQLIAAIETALAEA